MTYYLLYSFVWILSVLPLRVLYLFADLTAGLLHTVIGYRRKVVRANLQSAFPEKTDKEIAAIERKFYRFLVDYGVETIKLLTISEKQMLRRLQVENADVIDNAVDRGRCVTLLLGHYCNWEWVSSLPAHFAPGTVCAQVYHHLHNKAMNRLFMKIRTRFDANNIEMDDIMRRLIEWKRSGTPTVTGFIADQAPNLDIHLFLDFLNHDTPVYTGPERIAKFLNAEVYYCHLERPKRGYYRLRFDKITATPKREETFAITKAYFRMLEEDIQCAPQYWLWSHKRWKRTREMFNHYWGDKTEAQLSHL